ncbi:MULTISPECIES: NUDIX hydrolase [Pseudomonas]|uniref:DNA mismatch repair protein MutT n=1 Tax=Pseudomonas putida S12 TaxID=1215087 RepID=A0AA34WTX4_PSEPU|nr:MULTISPECIES: NUDIX domain-containing protein [Pseudomonas]AJA16773.1 DNA mismatch repair protein MutT [Pseudomonas putida S12]AOX11885.1 DNA mismatch repair protein MutT [Pseudomonas putida JB]MCI1024347.1 NUDIX domain-containing protein [Pseudomonas putida]MDN4513027.1 NUDIX domain-containing protein [Pseudomonas sp. 2,4-D]PWY39646.1 NUDIX domain-containing protein [Pseudomonas sp. RW405]
MTPDKVCPVVLSYSLPTKILLFRHPLAGTQLVKGTIENGETPSVAALRELAEETGIVDAVIGSDLGCWKADHQHQVWSFHLCRAGRELPESWVHQTLDDHGHRFDFFWASLDNLPYTDCHPVFQRALVFLCETLRASGHWRDEGPQHDH